MSGVFEGSGGEGKVSNRVLGRSIEVGIYRGWEGLEQRESEAGGAKSLAWLKVV